MAKQDLSQSKASEKCKVNRETFRKILTIDGYNARYSSLKKIADYFGVTVSKLLSEDKEKPTRKSRR